MATITPTAQAAIAVPNMQTKTQASAVGQSGWQPAASPSTATGRFGTRFGAAAKCKGPRRSTVRRVARADVSTSDGTANLARARAEIEAENERLRQALEAADLLDDEEHELQHLRAENAVLRQLAAEKLAALRPEVRLELAHEFAELDDLAKAAGEPVPIIIDPKMVREELSEAATYENASQVVKEETLEFNFEEEVATSTNAAIQHEVEEATEDLSPSILATPEDAVSTPVHESLPDAPVHELPTQPEPSLTHTSPELEPPSHVPDVAVMSSVSPMPSATPSKPSKKVVKKTAKPPSTEAAKQVAKAAAAARPSSPVPTAPETSVAKKSQQQKKIEAQKQKEAEYVINWDVERDAAAEEVAVLNAQTTVKGRESWLYFTVPKEPVHGEECVLFFNRVQSETLKSRPRIMAQIGFNNWELEGKMGPKLDLYPAECNRDEFSDWWWARFTVPEDAYEMKWVFTDGEGAYDNNAGQDFWTTIRGPMTPKKWAAMGAERAAEAERQRQEAEAKLKEEKEQEQGLKKLEGDLERAQWRVNELKRNKGWMQEGAMTRYYLGDVNKPEEMKTVWMIEPEVVRPGMKFTLQYNNKAGPLNYLVAQEGQGPVFKVGYNNWEGSQEYEAKRMTNIVEGENEEWWEAEIEVPPAAMAINFVVKYYDKYDNNGGKDYKIAVECDEEYESWDAWAETFLDHFKELEHNERVARETAEEAAKRKRDAKMSRMREHAYAVRRRQMKHVLFTEPTNIKGGETIALYYNPNNTELTGRTQIYLRGGFNHWRHKESFGPIEMIPPVDGDHYRATIKVPKDAHIIDFVFSDVMEGDGTYDSRGGLDYHLPVEGTGGTPAPLQVCHVAVEMAPICKVGGLGDVVTSLARAVQDSGHAVEVIVPRYSFFAQSPLLGGTSLECEFDWGGTRIYVHTCMVEGLRCYFIEPRNGFFDGGFVYGGRGDDVRFDFFCKAALEFMLKSGRQPDILHCHDWSTATVAKAYWDEYRNYGLYKSNVVFTIHNMNYGQAKIGEAAYYSQRFTTVSPTYAFEVGGHPTIAAHSLKFMGIRNGIDMDIWDPENDQFLPLKYNVENMEEGKFAAREELRKRMNLTGWGDKPIVAVVSRLTRQKGIHLIKHAAWRAVDRGCQFVLLGSAPDPKVQSDFQELADSLAGDSARFAFVFDEPLSHLIYAAADIILVPSMFEPCGLTQMIAMRYGAVPVVRSTGGLHDTVFDIDYDKARAAWEMEGSTDWKLDGIDATNGFAFEGTDSGALDFALNRAIDSWYNDKIWFRTLQRRVMQQDWSWNKPAIDYIELYYAAMKS